MTFTVWHIVGTSLDEIDDVADGIETFLDGIVDLVVNGADMVGHELRLGQVGRAFQAHSE